MRNYFIPNYYLETLFVEFRLEVISAMIWFLKIFSSTWVEKSYFCYYSNLSDLLAFIFILSRCFCFTVICSDESRIRSLLGFRASCCTLIDNFGAKSLRSILLFWRFTIRSGYTMGLKFWGGCIDSILSGAKPEYEFSVGYLIWRYAFASSSKLKSVRD